MDKMPAEDELDVELKDFKLNVTSDDILHMLSAVHVNPPIKSSSSVGNSNFKNDNDENTEEDEDEEIPMKQTRSNTSNSAKGRATRGRASRVTANKSTPSRATKHTMPALEVSRSTVSFVKEKVLINSKDNLKFLFISVLHRVNRLNRRCLIWWVILGQNKKFMKFQIPIPIRIKLKFFLLIKVFQICLNLVLNVYSIRI